jgi:hypothetical protein
MEAGYVYNPNVKKPNACIITETTGYVVEATEVKLC